MLLPKTPFSKGNHFGIALSESSLRAIQTDSAGVVVSHAEVQLEKSFIQGSELDQDLLREGLKALLQQASFAHTYAAICIPEKYAFSREHVFPSLSSQEIQEALQWQIDKIFPFSSHEIYADWKQIERTNTETRVLITVIPRPLLESLKNAIQSAGIFPISFEPSATALLRLLPEGSGKGLNAILEMNARDASATLVVDGISTLTTTAQFVSGETPEQGIVKVSEIITNLSSYLDRIKRTGEPLTLYVTGDQANATMTQQLGQVLKMEAVLLEVPEVSPKDHLAYSVGAVDVLPSASDQSINLLPTALQQYYDATVTYDYSKLVLRMVALFAGASVLLSAGVYGLSFYLNSGRTRELSLAEQSQIAAGSGEINLAEVSKNVGRFVSLFPLKRSPEPYLQGLYDLTPAAIDLKQATYTRSPERMTLLGVANSREEILAYKQAIEDSDLFERVSLPLSTFELSSEIPFTMELFVAKGAL